MQAQALADKFGKITNQLVDANGNKIFRYNCRTKNIELADGRSLHIYTIELQELNKPTELENHTGGNSSAGSEGSTMHHIAGSHSPEEPSNKNISQSEDKIKYSIGNDNSAESLKQKITEICGTYHYNYALTPADFIRFNSADRGYH